MLVLSSECETALDIVIFMRQPFDLGSVRVFFFFSSVDVKCIHAIKSIRVLATFPTNYGPIFAIRAVKEKTLFYASHEHGAQSH